MAEETARVIVDLDRYEQLIATEANFDTLTSLLFSTAQLNWKHDALVFDGTTVNDLMKGMYPAWYKTTFNKLHEELYGTQDKTAE